MSTPQDARARRREKKRRARKEAQFQAARASQNDDAKRVQTPAKKAT